MARPTQHFPVSTYVPCIIYDARLRPTVEEPPGLTLEYSVVEWQTQHIGRVPTAHQLGTPADHRQLGKPMQKRRKPPEPFTNYPIMLADIIMNSPRKKMTAQELYHYLSFNYPDYFPADGIDDQNSRR